MEALAGLARTISEEDYLDRILQAISEMVAETLDSPVCSIMLVDEDRRELVISAARCSSPDYLHKMPLKIEDSLIGRVVREGRVIVIRDVLEEKQYRYPELARRTGLASLLSVPLMTREKVIGTINIYTREVRQFTDDEIGFVKVVAGQAAIAIENARLMSESLEMKRTLERASSWSAPRHPAAQAQPHRGRGLPQAAQREPPPPALHARSGRSRDPVRRPRAQADPQVGKGVRRIFKVGHALACPFLHSFDSPESPGGDESKNDPHRQSQDEVPIRSGPPDQRPSHRRSAPPCHHIADGVSDRM